MDIMEKINKIENQGIREVLQEMAGEMQEGKKAKLTFARVRPEAILPTKREEDAGFDLYACVEQECIEIRPHETVMIPTGIATCFSAEYMFKLMERGSTGTKGIAQRSGVIDSGYRNEILAPIQNATEKTLFITSYLKDGKLDMENMPDIIDVAGGKQCNKISQTSKLFLADMEKNGDYLFYPMSKAITQGVLLYVPPVETEEIPYEELQKIPSQRGTKAWGSTEK